MFIILRNAASCRCFLRSFARLYSKDMSNYLFVHRHDLILELGGEQQQQSPKEILAQFGTDLTELARAGKLDPVIGREDEIRRTLQMYLAAWLVGNSHA